MAEKKIVGRNLVSKVVREGLCEGCPLSWDPKEKHQENITLDGDNSMCKDSEVEESLLHWKNWEKTCVAREEWMRGSVAPCAWRTHCLHAGEIQRLGGRDGQYKLLFPYNVLRFFRGISATAKEMQTLNCAAVECAILWVHFPCRRVRHMCFPAPPSGQAGSGAPS